MHNEPPNHLAAILGDTVLPCPDTPDTPGTVLPEIRTVTVPPEYRTDRHAQQYLSDHIEDILQEATEQGLLPLCHHKLARAGLLDTIPSDRRDSLRTHIRQTAASEMRLAKELVRALTYLHEAGINPILLKGAPLSYTIYPAPHLRPRCDTDILLPDRESAEQTWQILWENGYNRPNAVSGEIISQEFSCFIFITARLRHTIDIHWKLSNNLLFSRLFTFDELAAAAVTIPELANARALGPVHALLLACIHRIGHMPEQQENRLIWLYDIHLLCGSLTEEKWQELANLATAKKLTAICLDGLQQAAATLGTRIPTRIRDTLAARAEKEKLQPGIGASRASLELAKFRDLPTWRGKYRYIREHLFPPPDYMLRKYRTSRRYLLPLLYTRRILRGLPKLFK